MPKEITTQSKCDLHFRKKTDNLTDNVCVSIFAVCRHAGATAANGTITPTAGDTRGPKICVFYIKAPPNQQIQISCSAINLTNSARYLRVSLLW